METPEYRPLESREHEVIVWLLEHGPADAVKYIAQLDRMGVRSSCSCGCPSIEFSVPLDVPMVDSPPSMRLHATGHTGTDEVGLMLTAGSGVLSELEVYTFGGVDHAFGLPLLTSLVQETF